MNLPLTRIDIEKFRGLRNVTLEDMGRVNLLVGVNNSGKTSVLEAISTFCRPLDLRAYVQVVWQREFQIPRADLEDHYRWLFSQDFKQPEDWVGENLVRGSGTIDVLEVRAAAARIFRSEPILVQVGEYEDGEPEMEVVDIAEIGGIKFSFRASFKGGTEDQLAEVETWEDRTAVPKDHASGSRGCKVLNLSPYSHRMQPLLLKDLSKAIEDDWVEEVNALIQEIDPSILKLNILSDNRVHLKHSMLGSMPIQAFGDGVRRAILYALSVPSVKGGVLLIDEIESAIHVNALPKVFRWLVAACRKHDVQLVATTHSLEAVDAVIEGMSDDSDLVGYRLDRKEEETVAVRLAGEQLRRLRFERGLEIR